MTTITHIARFLLTEAGERDFVLKIAQVGAMPLSVPSFIRLTQEEASFHVEWRWLPGEPLEEMEVKRSGNAGPVIGALLRRLAETRPFAAQGIKMEPPRHDA